MDASKMMGMAEVLGNSGLQHKCLFKGQAYDDLRDVAPWIVRLAEDNSFTRHLFTHDPDDDVPWYLWAKRPGLYIRSTASLDQLWQHFRKFTRLQNEAGKWFYFRFWEPGPMVDYFTDMAADKGRVARWFNAYGHPVEVITPSTHIRPVPELTPNSTPLRLGTIEQRAFQRRAQWEVTDQMALDLRRQYPQETAQITEAELAARTARIVARLQGYGLRNGAHLYMMAVWDIMYGDAYETKEPSGQLQAILTKTTSEDIKFETYKRTLLSAEVA
nr:DUF4123 domain-containing protein [Sulfitobacter algicola]